MGKSMIAAIAAYALIAVVTFGHSASFTQAAEDAEHAECKADPRRTYCFKDEVSPGAMGLVSAMMWPLYWSWEVFSDD